MTQSLDSTIETSDSGLDPENLTVEELYAALRIHEELILTVPLDEVENIKRRLSQYKTRRMADDKTRRLSFNAIKGNVKVGDKGALIELQVHLRGRDTLPIFDIRKPEEY